MTGWQSVVADRIRIGLGMRAYDDLCSALYLQRALGLIDGDWRLAAVKPRQPQLKVANGTGVEQLALGCCQANAPRLPTAVVADHPGNGRLDLPATPQQRLP